MRSEEVLGSVRYNCNLIKSRNLIYIIIPETDMTKSIRIKTTYLENAKSQQYLAMIEGIR